MKRIALGLAAVLLSTAAAQADDLFAVAYGNTVTQTYNGQTTTIYVNADKTWEQHMPDGKVAKGTYAWKDDHTACFTVTDPAPQDPSKATMCNTIEGNHKVGDTWTENLPDNKGTITMAITAGRS
ncbi:MAG TPA: hypothetical protein VG867_05880 [Rhizomicrobium sp.]|nr:hypothetical protein [Rhizomicrobium sp.]